MYGLVVLGHEWNALKCSTSNLFFFYNNNFLEEWLFRETKVFHLWHHSKETTTLTFWHLCFKECKGGKCVIITHSVEKYQNCDKVSVNRLKHVSYVPPPRKLQKTEQDRVKLKYLTGEWFYETKSNRHRDKIHGSDIIRASMRHRKPVTIRECADRFAQ